MTIRDEIAQEGPTAVALPIETPTTGMPSPLSGADIDLGSAPPPPPRDLEYGFQTSQEGHTKAPSGGDDSLGKANPDARQTEEYQKAIRKKQCWIILISVVSIVVILFATGIIP